MTLIASVPFPGVDKLIGHAEFFRRFATAGSLARSPRNSLGLELDMPHDNRGSLPPERFKVIFNSLTEVWGYEYQVQDTEKVVEFEATQLAPPTLTTSGSRLYCACSSDKNRSVSAQRSAGIISV